MAPEKNPERLFEKTEKPTKSFPLGIEESASGKVVGDIWVYLIENNRMASVALRIAHDSFIGFEELENTMNNIFGRNLK